MWSVVSWFLIVLGFITLTTVILVGLVIFSYRRLVITLDSFHAFPDFKVKPASVIGSIFSVITGNFISAAAGLVNGVRLNGLIACANHSFVPLYIPYIRHIVSIGGKPCLNPIHTDAMWLFPGASKTIPINMTIGMSDIPQIALAGITEGGVIIIEIQSRATLGHFSYLKITSFSTKIPVYFSKAQ